MSATASTLLVPPMTYAETEIGKDAWPLMSDTSHQEHHLAAMREAKDEAFRKDPHSPLPEEQRTSFKGLTYYPLNPELSLELPIDRDVSDDPVTMETSTGDRQHYHRLGKVHFKVEGEDTTATVYQNHHGDLFLPIRDVTS